MADPKKGAAVRALLSDSFAAPDRSARARAGRAPEKDPGPTPTPPASVPGDAEDASVEAGTPASPAIPYKRTTVHLTDELSTWLRETAKGLDSDAFKMSDVLRLALNRLKADTADGLDLEPLLAEQLRAEAQRSPGRFKRRIPTD